MANDNRQQRERRAFTAEFKLEAVRRAEERRTAGACASPSAPGGLWRSGVLFSEPQLAAACGRHPNRRSRCRKSATALARWAGVKSGQY